MSCSSPSNGFERSPRDGSPPLSDAKSFLATILPVAFVAIRYIGETRDLDMAAYDEAMLL